MTKAKILVVALATLLCNNAVAQNYNQLTDDGTYTEAYDTSFGRNKRDTTKVKDKVVPRGLKVWRVDERFGDRIEARPDTLSHNYMNSIFTTGKYGEYNTTGNLGAPRINRIFIDRQDNQEQFIFTQPYDFFIQQPGEFLFTNTLSPITNLTYNECGDRTNGEDHLKALFGVNAGKKLGMGFKFDYIYGRGYYQNQSTSHFNYSMYASYLGERYNAHFLFSTNHQKVTENGGITDDRYITHPEVFTDDFSEDEIPTVLQKNWNRNDNQHIFFSHRYNIGFNRKVRMTDDEIKARKFAIESQKENEAEKAKEEARRKAQKEGKEFSDDDFENSKKKFAGRPEGSRIAGEEPIAETNGKSSEGRIKVDGKQVADSLIAIEKRQEVDTTWMKNEYVPVTSIIHTLKFDNYKRIYQAYDTPQDFYLNHFDVDNKFGGDSIFDQTKHYSLKNTLALAMLEGFNKWAKAGIKLFATSELRHFSLPALNGGRTSFNEHNLSVGGQISKAEGKTFHYSATAETWLTGEDAGQIRVDGTADLNFKLFGDTVRLAAKAYFHRQNPTFFYRHYHSQHLWWDNSLDKETRTRIEGLFSLDKTKTRLRVAVDNIQNYTYFAQRYSILRDENGNVKDGQSRTGNTVSVKQNGGNISLLTVQLGQDFKFGPLHWENLLTYQKSSNTDVLPVPELNVYTNLYLRFKLARVLNVDLGADARYFTKYTAPDYSPALGQYTVQDNGEGNVKTGNYPIVNVYANMKLKQARFFVMLSHVNASNGNYFLTPHYPINSMVIRFGVSWNFFN